MAEETSATLRPGPAQKSWQFPAAAVPSTFMRTTTSLKSRASMGANDTQTAGSRVAVRNVIPRGEAANSERPIIERQPCVPPPVKSQAETRGIGAGGGRS